jgi:tRNA splicing endonuclease
MTSMNQLTPKFKQLNDLIKNDEHCAEETKKQVKIFINEIIRIMNDNNQTSQLKEKFKYLKKIIENCSENTKKKSSQIIDDIQMIFQFNTTTFDMLHEIYKNKYPNEQSYDPHKIFTDMFSPK